MPELPEVETWRRLVDTAATGHRIESVWTADDPIVMDHPSPRSLRQRLRGLTVTGTGRRGKHLWLTFDRPGILYLHFGMTGSLHPYTRVQERPSHCKLELHLANDTLIGYRNLRRIGRARWYGDILEAPPLAGLGPDVLTDPPGPAEVGRRLKGRTGPIKSVLLDQSVFAGVGNWIADEVIYGAKLNPHSPACSLDARQCHRLSTNLNRVLTRAVADGADERNFPATWLFHHRWGKKADTTTRGERIQFDTIGGRTTAWVPEIADPIPRCSRG